MNIVMNDALASHLAAPAGETSVERAVLFSNDAGQRLVGVYHAPPASTLKATNPRATLLLLHGWSGTRSGPHQMLTRAARHFAASGYPVLRFDFSGRGDSEGEVELATLATMQADTRAALRWCRENELAQNPIVLGGLCSGCEVAVATSGEREVGGLMLWSAPVFAAAASLERAARKRGANLKAYARKLLRPQTYAKILRGAVDTQAVKQVLAHSGGEAKNAETGAAGALPRGWRAAALQQFQAAAHPTLLVYGTADPTTAEALPWYREHLRAEPSVHWVQGANHSYYGLEWEREVVQVSQQWLDANF